MKITHIVGLQGTGKSTLAALMVADLESRGARCAVVDSDAMVVDFKSNCALAVAAHTGVDHLFLEWMPHSFTYAAVPDGDSRVINVVHIPRLAPTTTPTGQGA